MQEFIEEGEIHFIAHGSASLADQACIIPERLAELEGLNEPLFTSGGVRVFNTLKYFKGDKPAAEFEAGISCGGNFPCVGCVCSLLASQILLMLLLVSRVPRDRTRKLHCKVSLGTSLGC